MVGQFLEQLYFATFAGLPVPLFVVAAAFAACHVLLRRTAFGAELRAIGTNAEAAIASAEMASPVTLSQTPAMLSAKPPLKVKQSSARPRA